MQTHFAVQRGGRCFGLLLLSVMKCPGLYDRTSGQCWRHCGHRECVFFHIIKNLTLRTLLWQMATWFCAHIRCSPSLPFPWRPALVPVRMLKHQKRLCRTERVSKQIVKGKIQGIYTGERNNASLREGGGQGGRERERERLPLPWKC